MRALIVEDEPLAIENLMFYLKDYPIEIIGAVSRIPEAIELIKKNKPDVVFLDINLSGENGFELLDKIDTGFKTIFVTAYDEYAIRAFEVNALDYILKPLKKERVDKAVNRLLKEKTETTNRPNYTITDTIFLSNGNRASFIKLKDICFIEADSCYSKVVLSGTNTKVLPQTLKRWEDLLPREEFIRVHRSYIININQVKEIKKKNNSTYEVFFLSTNGSIEISRRYASDLKAKFIIQL
ncbi:MAG: LytTR family DNA-binding domain-containing protein [Ignavibacteriales bacterium]|nr:LytTR family DNA-binding domain-containing protein [Ignavibacteriales bacterium]